MAPKLCLIDASGYIHRAYHAIPPLSTSRGEPVNAVYGYTRMVSKVLKEEKPEYLAVCFDTPAATFRHDAYTEYKANRKETDEALIFQLPIAEELTRAWGLPAFKKDGYEADDIIATLARYGRSQGWDVLILSGDKDILQLVHNGLRVRDELRKVDFDDEKVKARYGISADQLLDYFSLIGDKVDNVPGVPGVGEKTAAKLIQTYGSLETLFLKLNGEKPALKEKLVKHRSDVYRNRSLIALKEDVPLEVSLDRLKMMGPNIQTFPALLNRLEFRGDLFGAKESSAEPGASENKIRKTHTVLTEKDLKSLRDELSRSPRVAYDLETDGLDTRRCNIVGISMSVKPQEAWYVPVGHRYIGAPDQLSWSRIKELLAPILKDTRLLKIGQNLKFDNSILERCGLGVNGPFFDTLIAAYVIDSGRSGFGLKELAVDYLQEQMTKIDELIGKGKEETFATVSIEKAAEYSGADAEVTFRLSEVFEEKIKRENLAALFHDLEMPLVQVIQDMEQAGIAVDAGHLEEVGRRFRMRLGVLEKEIHALAGEEFALNSPKQLSKILFEKLKLPTGKKTKTGFSTDEDVLRKLALNHPICEKIINSRELAKLTSTYVESLLELRDPDSGRVHSTFHQTGTVTGRLSSSNPNLQNIPIRSENGQDIRRAFVPAAGSIFISADYSQIDLRVLAHVSQDPVLIQTFQQAGDIHSATAAQMFQVKPGEVTPQMRRSAKAINFGIVYGQQAFALAQSFGVSQDEAQLFINKYFERYAGVRAWIESSLAEARKTGVVTTLSGRRRFLSDINAANSFARSFAERVAINTPIQGSSADIIKHAMLRLHRQFREKNLKTKMLVQVHDELLFETPLGELTAVLPLIKEGMESALALRVPLVVDMKKGFNWNDMDKV